MTAKTPRKRARKARSISALPVVQPKSKIDPPKDFPVKKYSYSMWSRFCTNPVLGRILYINHDTIDTTRSSTSVLGAAVHEGLKTYLGGNDEFPVMLSDSDAERLKYALEAANAYIDKVPDGFIDWKPACNTRGRLRELALVSIPKYVREWDRTEVKQELIVEQELTQALRITHGSREIELPVPITGYPDDVYEDTQGRIRIVDHKTVYRYSDPEAIDGSKLIQAAMYYLLVYAETGKAPYSINFREFKIPENQDGSAQTREFVIVYEEMPIVFDLFFRLYEDITRMLLGEAVYLPNILAMFDRDVALLAYIYRLDEPENLQKQMRKNRAADVAELMQKKLSRSRNLKRFLEAKASLFTSSVSLDYNTMQPHEKIRYKLFEHGIALDFADKVEGLAVDLYRFRPTVGVKMSTLEKYTKDVQQVLASDKVRILAPILGTDMVGFEVPRKKRTFVKLEGAKSAGELAFPVGVDVYGEQVNVSLPEMPHGLVAGTTGSGKSSFIVSTLSALAKRPTKEIVFALCDPKLVELAEFADDKHTVEYRTDPLEILAVLEGYVQEMDSRYELFRKKKVRSLEQYRDKVSKDIPYVLIVIDEFADLILGGHTHEEEQAAGEYLSGPRKGETRIKTKRTDVSGEIKRRMIQLASKARAAGIHLLIATQRPSAKVVDGLIKANFPTRFAFRTVSKVESEIILDRQGAELLMGKGDMLLSSSAGELRRLQAYLTE